MLVDHGPGLTALDGRVSSGRLPYGTLHSKTLKPNAPAL